MYIHNSCACNGDNLSLLVKTANAYKKMNAVMNLFMLVEGEMEVN